jgi:hypothetical protein
MTPRFLIITQYVHTVRDRFAVDSETGRDLLYFHDVPPTEGLSRELRLPHQVLYAETEEAANAIARNVLFKNPGVTTYVGKIDTMFSAKTPPKVDVLTAKYTAKGLVPE